jgi:Family of unknown function (DUF5522)
MSNPSTALVEGIDYYIEDGRWVFTAEYHLKRGQCCENVCRHCPFGNSPSDRTEAANDGLPDKARDSV